MIEHSFMMYYSLKKRFKHLELILFKAVQGLMVCQMMFFSFHLCSPVRSPEDLSLV